MKKVMASFLLAFGLLMISVVSKAQWSPRKWDPYPISCFFQGQVVSYGNLCIPGSVGGCVANLCPDNPQQ